MDAEQIRHEQRVLADRLAHALIPAEFNVETIYRCNELLEFRHDPLKIDQIDSSVYMTLLRDRFRGGTLVALQAYTDLVATQIIQSGDYAPCTLPMLEDGDRELISLKYGVPLPLVKRVIGMLRGESYLPLLGQIYDGRLVPDRAALSTWHAIPESRKTDFDLRSHPPSSA